MPVFSCGGMRFQQSWTASHPVSESSQQKLTATVERALSLGINHFETARGYGTSEAQLGQALAPIPRDRLILQTKVPPKADPREFEQCLEESFERLRVDRVDLFGFHGLNAKKYVEWTLRSGGCYEVAERFRKAGRIGHIGFSTHAPCDVIVDAINSNKFDYVNLHWYFIFQENAPAIAAAAARDMGVFIISPSDKGGHLHTPRPLWLQDCAPLTPMQFNDLFCLANPNVATLSLGAANPAQFDEHLEVLPILNAPDTHLEPIVQRLEARWRAVLGEPFAHSYLQGVPEWDQLPGGVNVRKTLWLWGLVKAFDLLPYAQSRYNMLGQDDHWFPGNKAVNYDPRALARGLAGSPHIDRILAILPEAHGILNRTE